MKDGKTTKDGEEGGGINSVSEGKREKENENNLMDGGKEGERGRGRKGDVESLCGREVKKERRRKKLKVVRRKGGKSSERGGREGT